MTKKTLLLVLAIFFLMASTAMWAQIEPYEPTTTVNTNGSVPATGSLYGTTPTNGMTGASPTGAGPAYDPTFVPLRGSDHGDPAANGGTVNPGSSGAVMDVLGGHGRSNGCMFCHTPHGTGRLDPTTREKIRNNVTNAGGFFKGQTFNYVPNNYNGPQNTSIYLWSMAMTTTTYTTWDGQTFNGSKATRNSPEVHTLLCMQCHDNAMHYHAMQDGFFPESGVTAGTIDPTTKNVIWGDGTLVANHPVHVKYEAAGHNWNITIDAANNKVTFNDADTNQIGDTGFYGHPARLYTDGTDAYIECTSCHNPHRQTSPAYQMKDGKWTVGAYGTTELFVRGPYSQADGTISAGFCRSCHYSKSPEYVRNNGAAK